jgi:hypothetical protein
MLRISNATVHIVPHGSMSHALMFAREVRLLSALRYLSNSVSRLFYFLARPTP